MRGYKNMGSMPIYVHTGEKTQVIYRMLFKANMNGVCIVRYQKMWFFARFYLGKWHIHVKNTLTV